MKKATVAIFILAALTTGCARKSNPQYFDQLIRLSSPQSEHESDGLFVYFHNAMFYEDEIAIDVRVTNYTDEEVEVFPMDWNYMINYTRQSYMDAELGYLVNPLTRIDELQKARKSAKQWWKRPVADLLIYGATAGAGTAMGAEGEMDVPATSEEILPRTTDLKTSVKVMKETAFWESVILKPTKLAPGESVTGLIFFDYRPDARNYEIFANLGNHKITHVVQQHFSD